MHYRMCVSYKLLYAYVYVECMHAHFSRHESGCPLCSSKEGHVTGISPSDEVTESLFMWKTPSGLQ